MDHEVVVEADLAGHRARGLLGQGHEDVGRGGIGPALEQAGQQQVALLPAGQLLVVLDALGPGQQPLGLELDEDGGHQQELGELVESIMVPLVGQDAARSRRPPGAAGCRARPPRGTTPGGAAGRSALEDRGGHRVGHPSTLPNAAAAAACTLSRPRARRTVPCAPHEQGPFRHRAFGQLHLRQLPRGPAPLGQLPGRQRRLLLRGRPARPDRPRSTRPCCGPTPSMPPSTSWPSASTRSAAPSSSRATCPSTPA